jgi:glucokinase
MKALAFDLGGTHVTCGIVEDRTLLRSQVVSADGTKGLRDLLPGIAAAFRKLLNKSNLTAEDCSGIACSLCNIIDARESKVLSTNQKYDDMPSIDFPGWAREEFGLPLRMENDARMALLGEYYAGAARGFEDVVMVTLGTGIGGAAMIGGRLLRGKHSQAGNLGGHIPVVLHGRACTCGGIGCAESEAAGWSLPLVAHDWPNFSNSALAREPQINFEALFRLAGQNDAVAMGIRDRCLDVWAADAAGLVHSFDPEIIVFGGGVMHSADVILPLVRSHIERHTWTPWGKVQVQAAQLGNDAGLLGAIPLLQEQF